MGDRVGIAVGCGDDARRRASERALDAIEVGAEAIALGAGQPAERGAFAQSARRAQGE